jgi:nicotinamidase-related amidase
MLSLPRYYSSEDAGVLRIERAATVAAEARTLRLKPAADDRERVAVFGIDAQIGFCHPEGSLFVPGAVEDTRRALEFFYPRLDRITTMVMSLDTHAVHQIFHPSHWRDDKGEPPAPFTPITRADVESGKWTPVRDREASIEYVARLEKSGKYVLTIWPYHTLLGGVSHALVPAVMEMCILHALARDARTVFETKGSEPLTENYSVLSPEVTELAGRRVGAFNETLFDTLMQHDRVFVFGQAKSHCVLSTLLDMRARIEKTPDARGLAKKIVVLADAMSPVPAPPISPLPDTLNFPVIAERAFEELVAFGMTITTTRDALRFFGE